MALRSVLRKLPALGLRSPAMGPLMGPVRTPSPAVGSRLISSHGAPGAQTIQSEGTLAEELKSLKLRQVELFRKSAEQERRTAAEFDKNMEQHRQDIAYYSELERRANEDFSRGIDKLESLGKKFTVLSIAFPAAALLLIIHSKLT